MLSRDITSAGVLLSLSLAAATANATPSTQVWIPSTDIQKFSTVHLNYDVYARPAKNTILVMGPTAGILPWELVQAELGFDYVLQSNEQLDAHPVYLHAKIGTPEASIARWSPSIAVGIYNVGIERDVTDQNLAYGLVARTLPYLGRLSIGYYYGNGKLLLDEHGDKANHGLLASWDRTLAELSDRLWLAVDYQGGGSALGALSFGVAWAFAPNVSVIAGYNRYLSRDVAGKDTATVQLDINLEPFSHE